MNLNETEWATLRAMAAYLLADAKPDEFDPKYTYVYGSLYPMEYELLKKLAQ